MLLNLATGVPREVELEDAMLGHTCTPGACGCHRLDVRSAGRRRVRAVAARIGASALLGALIACGSFATGDLGSDPGVSDSGARESGADGAS